MQKADTSPPPTQASKATSQPPTQTSQATKPKRKRSKLTEASKKAISKAWPSTTTPSIATTPPIATIGMIPLNKLTVKRTQNIGT